MLYAICYILYAVYNIFSLGPTIFSCRRWLRLTFSMPDPLRFRICSMPDPVRCRIFFLSGSVSIPDLCSMPDPVRCRICFDAGSVSIPDLFDAGSCLLPDGFPFRIRFDSGSFSKLNVNQLYERVFSSTLFGPVMGGVSSYCYYNVYIPNPDRNRWTWCATQSL